MPGHRVAALISQHGEYTLETVSPGRRAAVRAHHRRSARSCRTIRRCSAWSSSARRPRPGSCPSRSPKPATTWGPTVALNLAHPDVRADLAGAPGTIYGALAAILRDRLGATAGPSHCSAATTCAATDRFSAPNLIDFLERRGEADLRGWVEAQHHLPLQHGRPDHAAAVGGPRRPREGRARASRTWHR